MPAVGDWVAVVDAPGDGAAIEAVLPGARSSRARRLAKAEEHILVANVDMLFLVAGLDQDFNPRRLERYLTAAWDSGADPVVVLTKLDLCDDLRKIDEAEAVAIGVPVLPSATSPATGSTRSARCCSLHERSPCSDPPAREVDARQPARRAHAHADGDLRRDGRGRHTTRHRQLLVLRDGSILVDTPGLRELQIWEGDVDSAFSDVAELASQCRFNDCAHRTSRLRGAGRRSRRRAHRRALGELPEARRERAGSRCARSREHRELKSRWAGRARETRRERRYGGKP